MKEREREERGEAIFGGKGREQNERKDKYEREEKKAEKKINMENMKGR